MGITFNHVSFSFTGQNVLENIQLSLGEGITAVMGPNGAGKTTLLQLAASILTPTTGELQFEGEPYATSCGRVRRSLGFLPQILDFPESLTPRKLITYLAQLRFLNPSLGMQELERLGISGWADRPFEALSMGEIRLAGLAQALMGDPYLLLLDEPFHGLDALERDTVLRAIQASWQPRIVVFSTHVANEIELLATRVIVLSEGRVLYSGAIEELRRQAAGQVYEMCLSSQDKETSLTGMYVSRRSERNGKTVLRVIGQPPKGIDLTPVEPTLEDAYLLVMHHVTYQAACTNTTNRQTCAP